MKVIVHRLHWELLVFGARWRNRLRYLLAVPFVYRNWWAWLLPKLGISIVLEARNGLRYWVRTGTTDLGVVNEAMILNPYLGSGYLALQDDAVVVDVVGANIGDFKVQAAALCPQGRVVAVESISQNVQMINVNTALNGSSNVEVVHLALGSHRGQTEIRPSRSRSSADRILAARVVRRDKPAWSRE